MKEKLHWSCIPTSNLSYLKYSLHYQKVTIILWVILALFFGFFYEYAGV